MALAKKDHMPNDSTMAIIHASSFYEHNFGSGPSEIYGIDEHQKGVYHEPESPEKACGLAKNFTMSNSSSVSSPSSTNSNNNGLGYQTTPYNLSEEGHSMIMSFKPATQYANFSGSLLSFNHQAKRVQRNLFPKLIGGEDEFPIWEDDLSGDAYTNNNISHVDPKYVVSHGLPETSSSHHSAATSYGGVQFAWMNDQEANTITNGTHELVRQDASNNKRPSTGENMRALKKQCVVASSSSPSKKPKQKSNTPSPSPSPSKDPQSVAAKNRRERISERLKILQDLVPNGSKVDLVTMLEKAISYVKFLQLQVKVLATDEFWPAQGGKAPELSQVKEAIDAILASQRDRSSSSK